MRVFSDAIMSGKIRIDYATVAGVTTVTVHSNSDQPKMMVRIPVGVRCSKQFDEGEALGFSTDGNRKFGFVNYKVSVKHLTPGFISSGMSKALATVGNETTSTELGVFSVTSRIPVRKGLVKGSSWLLSPTVEIKGKGKVTFVFENLSLSRTAEQKKILP
jgi:hypothetical protein